MNRCLSVLIVIALMAGCKPSGSSSPSGLITNRGTFPSPSGAHNLVIGKKPKSLVDYKIVEISTNREFAPKNLFSDAMRWAAFWESDTVLWVHSSDMGLSVWKADSNGDFSHEWLGPNSPLILEIPQKVWDFLPSSIKRRWEPQRQPNSEQEGAGQPASR